MSSPTPSSFQDGADHVTREAGSTIENTVSFGASDACSQLSTTASQITGLRQGLEEARAALFGVQEMLVKLGKGLDALTSAQVHSESSHEPLSCCAPTLNTPEVNTAVQIPPSPAGSVTSPPSVTVATTDILTLESMRAATMNDFMKKLPGCSTKILTRLLIASEQANDDLLMKKAKCIEPVLMYREWESGGPELRKHLRSDVCRASIDFNSFLEGLSRRPVSEGGIYAQEEDCLEIAWRCMKTPPADDAESDVIAPGTDNED